MSTTLDNLAPYITEYLAQKDVVNTSLKSTAKLNKLMQRKKSQGGSNWDISIRNENSSKGTKFFEPDGATDTIGTGNSYTRIEPVVTATAAWSFLLEEFKYSKVQYEQYRTAGKAQLADYLNTRLDFGMENMEDAIADGIVNGTGNGNQGTLPSVTGSVAQELYGLKYQQRAYSGTIGANTEKQADNLHLGLARHLHPALVGNVFDDTTAYGATVTELAITLTNGNTTVPGVTSVDYTPYIGWELWYRPAGSGSYERMGREYVVADATAGAATSFQMAQVFRGATGSYDIQIRAPFDATAHGAQGSWTVEKLNKAYARASGAKSGVGGIGSPDFACCNPETFQSFMNYLQQLQRWTFSKDAKLENEGYQNFKYNTCTVIVDPYESDGVVRFETSKHQNFYTLTGMDKFTITRADMYEAPNEDGVQQIVCAPVFTSQIVDASPRSSAVITGLNV